MASVIALAKRRARRVLPRRRALGTRRGQKLARSPCTRRVERRWAHVGCADADLEGATCTCANRASCARRTASGWRCCCARTARKKPAHVMFSDDEAKSWSAPRRAAASLCGDRHVGAYGPDGRLLLSFRDMAKAARRAATGWPGSAPSRISRRATKGQYRVRLSRNWHAAPTVVSGRRSAGGRHVRADHLRALGTGPDGICAHRSPEAHRTRRTRERACADVRARIDHGAVRSACG
jgi:hypothetical protein